jgi:protein-S-isoprenylcysteine O-methyltransferase Ste14
MTPTAPDNAAVPGRPPNVAIGILLVGLALDFVWPTRFPGGRAHLAAGLAMLAAGIALFLRASGQFRAAGTNIETWRPTEAIVTHGVYARSRNPIYVSMLSIYAGLAVLANSVWALGLGLALFAYLRFFVIPREERYLERKFGDAYRAYKASVRRWL